MVEMDKIVIEKKGWVYLFQPNLEGRAIFRSRIPNRMAELLEYAGSLDRLSLGLVDAGVQRRQSTDRFRRCPIE